jgi:hypothetical protein
MQCKRPCTSYLCNQYYGIMLSRSISLCLSIVYAQLRNVQFKTFLFCPSESFTSIFSCYVTTRFLNHFSHQCVFPLETRIFLLCRQQNKSQWTKQLYNNNCVCIINKQIHNWLTIYYTALYYTASTCFDVLASSSGSS